MWDLGLKFSFNGVLLGAGAHRLSSLCCDESLGHLHMILIVNGFLRCQNFFFFFFFYYIEQNAKGSSRFQQKQNRDFRSTAGPSRQGDSS